MKRFPLFGAVAMAVALLVAACGGADPTPAPAPTAAPQPTAAPKATEAPKAAAPKPTATSKAATGARGTAVPRATVTPFPTASPTPEGQKIQRGGVLVTALRDKTAGPSVQNAINNPALGPRHQWVGRKIFQGIMWNDPYDNHLLKPYVAESAVFNASADGLTFKVNPNAKWADGNPITAKDLAFNINAWASPPEGFANTTATNAIKGAVARADVVGTNTVSVVLKRTSVSILNAFAQYDVLLVPSYRTFEESYTDPMGSGAFERMSIDTDVKYEFVKNPNYWVKGPQGETLPYLDGIESIIFTDGSRVFAGILTGQLDVAHGEWGAALSGKRGQIKSRLPDAVVQTRFATATGWGFRNKAPFNKPGVTKAFFLATDRLADVELGKSGLGTIDPTGVLYPASGNVWALPMAEVMATPGYRYLDRATGKVELDQYKIVAGGAEKYEKDPADIAAAKKLLADAGLDPTKGQFPDVTLLSDTTYNADESTVLAQTLSESLGVKFTLDMKDFASAQAARGDGNFEANQSWSYTPGFDPSNSLRWFTTKTHYHNHGYEVPKWDAMYAKQDQEVDPKKRAQLVFDMQRMIIRAEHPAIIPMSGYHGDSGINREWVMNLPIPVISLTTVWYWDQTWIDTTVSGRAS